MSTTLNLPVIGGLLLLGGCTCVPPTTTPTTSTNSLKIVTVSGVLNTTPNNGVDGQGVNLAAGAGAQLPFDKIKRYTVTLHTAVLANAPAGANRIELYVGVLQGGTAYSVRVLRQDPATASPFPHAGFTVAPYTGTNSHFKVFRGNDGLGPVEVRYNAYVELEP